MKHVMLTSLVGIGLSLLLLAGCAVDYYDPEVVTRAAKEVETCRQIAGATPLVASYGANSLSVSCQFHHNRQ